MGGFNSKTEEDNIPKTADSPRFIGFTYPLPTTPSEDITTTTTICMSPSDLKSWQPTQAQTDIPTVITWTGGGKDVYVTGSFNGWKEKIPLTKSEKDFTVIQNLPPGIHQYKFIVDGKWRHATDLPVATDVAGNINNCIEVLPQTDELQTRALSSSPPGGYSQNDLVADYSKDPPNIPPHLLRALLNTAPSTDDPSVLPLPHHVMINHLYSLYASDPKGKQDYMILGVTSRYKAKFVTTTFYKPVSSTTPTQPMELN